MHVVVEVETTVFSEETQFVTQESNRLSIDELYDTGFESFVIQLLYRFWISIKPD